MLNLKQLKILLLSIGLLLATISGYFSVVGLSHLFGNSIEVWIMASILELSKVVSVSFISNDFFNSISKTLKTYILTSTFLLMLITSMGVYGYLSSKYQNIDNKIKTIQLEKDKFNVKLNNYKSQIKIFEEENKRINLQINNIQNNQNNNLTITSQFLNKKNYNRMLGSINKNNKDISKQINELNNTINNNFTEIKNINDSIQVLNNELTKVNIKENLNSDVNSLKFISILTGIQFNYIINVLIVILVVVLDPLAISLLISSNKIKEEKTLSGKLDNYIFLK
jgi:hypothetical protein